MSKRIFGTYTPSTKTTSVILDGTHHTLEGDNAKEAYRLLVEYNRNPTEDLFDEITDLISPNVRLVSNLFNGSFYMNEDTGDYFMDNTSVVVPEALVRLLKEYDENDFPMEALSNFWSLCLLNPNEEARERFLEYCLDYNIVITDMGYAVLYKAVTHKTKAEKDEDLAAFVAEQITAVKRRRKPASSYRVYRVPADTQIGNGDIVKAGFFASRTHYPDFQFLGTLQDLHENIEELSVKSGTVYTDKHTQTMDIHIGVPQVKERSQCDPNISRGCSYGLHVGSHSYVSSFGNVSDTIFACLVNPANVVAVPTHDNSKIRVCEYFPYSIMEQVEETYTDPDTGIRYNAGQWFELDNTYFESDYAAYEIEDLKNGFFEEAEMEEIVISRYETISEHESFEELPEKEEAPNDGVYTGTLFY